MKEADSRIEFLAARNGQETCRLDNKYFHSAYNPGNEAQSFTASISLGFNPSCLVIIEPALSYCAQFLRKKFPGTKLYAIRLSGAFSKTDSLWDKAIPWTESSFSQRLFSAIGEENLLAAGFLDWPGSRNIFSAQASLVWKEIKDAVLLARDVMNTRAHFSEKWILNSARFFKSLDRYCSHIKTDKNILVAASGPSLGESVKYIKAHRNCFFLICVSSALPVMLFHKIRPDIVISTDGGYWAKKHIELSEKESRMLSGTVFALPDEACCPGTTLKSSRILPLVYPQSTGEKIYRKLGIRAFPALRNGTVSGTAAVLALSLTGRNVYFCGLDLSPSPGFQHTNPNALENRAMNFDRRLATKETRQASARFGSEGSLALYRNWFKSQPESFCSRIFRLHEKYEFESSLSPIKDVLWTDVLPGFEQEASGAGTSAPIETDVPKAQRNEKILEAVEEAMSSSQFQSEIFPLESLMAKRAASEKEKEVAESKIKAKRDALEKKIRRILR